MKCFSEDITTETGAIVGCFSGAVCSFVDDVFQSLDLIVDPEFIKTWESRIIGGFRFPCSVLSRIDIWAEFENLGMGTKGMKQFNDKAVSLGAVMGVVRIGWQGDPVEERMAKSFHFYEKTGWNQIHREDEFEIHLAYRIY